MVPEWHARLLVDHEELVRLVSVSIVYEGAYLALATLHRSIAIRRRHEQRRWRWRWRPWWRHRGW